MDNNCYRRKGITGYNFIELSEAGKVVRGSTLVPLRFVAESFGAYVHWNGSDKFVSISSDGSKVAYESTYVRINTASVDQLKRIKHINEDRAAEIVRLRKDQKFESYEDLIRIKGIGEARMKDIKEQGIIKF